MVHVVKSGRPDEVKAVKAALDFAVKFGRTQNWQFPNYASGLRDLDSGFRHSNTDGLRNLVWRTMRLCGLNVGSRQWNF